MVFSEFLKSGTGEYLSSRVWKNQNRRLVPTDFRRGDNPHTGTPRRKGNYDGLPTRVCQREVPGISLRLNWVIHLIEITL